MTFKKIFTCSECGRERRQANHWFVSTRTGRGLEFYSWEWAVRRAYSRTNSWVISADRGAGISLLDSFLNERTTAE